jgi:hypothetical protein
VTSSSATDGISCLYVRRGGASTLLTRGNGKSGKTSHMARYIRNLPIDLLANQDIIVRGELVILKKDFETLFSDDFANMRNPLPDASGSQAESRRTDYICRVRNSVTLRSNEVIRAAPAHEDYGHSHYRQSVARHIRFNPDYVQGKLTGSSISTVLSSLWTSHTPSSLVPIPSTLSLSRTSPWWRQRTSKSNASHGTCHATDV